MTARHVATALTAVALAGCGGTYVEQTPTTTTAAVTTVPTIDPTAPLGDLLGEIETLMFDLDERIIDERGHVETMARIDALWAVAEARIRAADPDDVFNFEQAIELARSGVERRRPADASKGYKILADVIDAYPPTP